MCLALGFLFNARFIWQGLGLSGSSQRGAAFVPPIVFSLIFRLFGPPRLRAALLRAFAIEPFLKLEESAMSEISFRSAEERNDPLLSLHVSFLRAFAASHPSYSGCNIYLDRDFRLSN